MSFFYSLWTNAHACKSFVLVPLLSTGDAWINKKIASCSSFCKMSLCIYELSTWIHTSCVSLQAVRLLKRGGVLVYSTCTVTLAENEELVAWALNTFPCLTLQPQVTNMSATWKDSQIQSDVRKRHQVTLVFFLRSLTSAQKACWEPACHLSSCDSSRGSAPSWAGTRRGRRLPSPAEPTGTPSASLLPSSWKTDRRARFLSQHRQPSHCRDCRLEQSCLYYDTLCALTGQCWQRRSLRCLQHLPLNSCSLKLRAI